MLKTIACAALAAFLMAAMIRESFAADYDPVSAPVPASASSSPSGSAPAPLRASRFYAGGALGASTFTLPDTDPPAPDKSGKSAAALKFYGGYRFTPNFSLEGGYARLGSLRKWDGVSGVAMQQKGAAQMFYAAAAVRWPIGLSFALNGRLGLASGKISESNRVLPDAPEKGGRATGLMAGAGVEYRLSDRFALTADYDHFDKVSKHSRGGMVAVGGRVDF
jgi:OOP family OmpA-OmpF porin